MVAMVGRIIEMNDHNRVEAVRLPNIYQEKELKQREEDKCDLLEQFQKLLVKHNDFTKIN